MTNEDMAAWVAAALLLYNLVGVTDANASTAIVEVASNPDTASMFMESLKTGLAENINQVKEIISNSEMANSEVVQNTLSSIQGATDTVKETAQVAGENVKGALDKLKGLMPGQT